MSTTTLSGLPLVSAVIKDVCLCLFHKHDAVSFGWCHKAKSGTKEVKLSLFTVIITVYVGNP